MDQFSFDQPIPHLIRDLLATSDLVPFNAHVLVCTTFQSLHVLPCSLATSGVRHIFSK